MKVIEKIGLDKDVLLNEFEKFSNRYGKYRCERSWKNDETNRLITFARNKSVYEFFNWAYSEYPEYSKFQIVNRHYIVLNNIPDNSQNIIVVDLFSTGWNYHYNLLVEKGLDISKIYNGYEQPVNMYAIQPYDSICLTNEEVIACIDSNLKELDSKSFKDDKPFYDTYIAAIRYLKKCIEESKNIWEDIDLLKRMGLEKWC